MFDLFSQLWTMLQHAAPEAFVKALIVLFSVLALRVLSVVPTSKWARAANVTLSVLLSGALSGAVTQEEVLLLTLTMSFSAGLWEAIVSAYKYINGGKKPFALPVPPAKK